MAFPSTLTSFVARSSRITADWLNGVDKLLVGRPFGYNAIGDGGLKGDGSTDDTAAWASLITTAGVGGTIIFPKPSSYYKLTDSLTPLAGQTWIGEADWSQSGAWVRGNFAGPLIEAADVTDFTLRGLSFSGGGATSGSKGIHATNADRWVIDTCRFHNFGDQAIYIESGTAGVFNHIYAYSCLLVTSDRNAYVGVVDIGVDDPLMTWIEATASSSAAGDGYCAGIVVRGTNGFMHHCIGEISEVGIVFMTGGTAWCAVDNRADLNYRGGFVVNCSVSQFIGNRAYRNGRAADNTYDGFTVGNHGNVFVGNMISSLGSDTNFQRHGFTDTATNTTDSLANEYLGNKAYNIDGSLYNLTGANRHRVGRAGRQHVATPTTTYTAKYSDDLVLADASGGGFTVTLPGATATGKTLTIKRTSASNDVTVDGASSETIDGAATKTLGSQHAFVTLVADGTNWQITASGGTVT